MKKLFLKLPLLIGFLLVFGTMSRLYGEEAGYAGSETCKSCHESQFNSYARTTHGVKADPRSPASKHECETCHGPGQAHVDAGGQGGIISFGKKSTLSVQQQNATCLSCHDRFPLNSKLSREHWDGSVHEKRGLSCVTCHSVHSGFDKNLSKPTQQETCLQCHKQMRAELLKPSHHPIREGKVTCTDCHNPHGAVADKMISANTVNEKCFQCHAEKRGPFLYEHAPVTENCLTCHTPHGSAHPKLTKTRVPFLCQECHSNSRHPGTLYAESTKQAGQSVYKALSTRIAYRACLNCHSEIHGSNHPSGKSLAR